MGEVFLMADLDNRVHYRRTVRFNTDSNKTRRVRTPGGKLVMQHIKKKGDYTRCAITGVKLPGFKKVRPIDRKRNKKNVSRPYGGHFCAKVVKDRILRSFLVNEQKCVRALISERIKAEKKSKTKK